MPETQTEINALLAEMSALAAEAADGGPLREPVPAPAAPEPAKPSPAAPVRSSPAPRAAASAQTGPRRNEDIQRILTIEVPVIVQLAERNMPVSKILNLSNGAIIEFDKPFDAPLELMINNKCIGTGQAVKAGENFGLRVTHIGSVQSRIKALGSP
jgi:flagellar motor switch protein FliN/FliY